MEQIRKIRTGTKIVSNKETSSVQHITSDICVVGAGIAGISTALEAASLGRNVTLIDGLPSLGGQAVNSIIGIFCGLFSNHKEPYQFTRGIADGILRDLGAAGELNYRYGKNNVVMYDEIALARWIENAVSKAGINVILGGVIRGVSSNGRKIKSLDVATRYGDMVVESVSFVDATGDASLAWQAGLPCRTSAEGPIYGTQMIVVEGVNTDKIPDRNEVSERLAKKANEYGLIRKDGFAFAFPGKGTALVNMTHVETPLDPIKIAQSSLEGKAQADDVFRYLKREYPGAFGEARIRSYGQLGIRQTRWIVGQHQLTLDEVMSGKKFEDAIARTAWPIELHDDAEGYVWHQFPEEHVHYIPLRSLTPPDVDNLMAVGRCIDGDLAALSSVRVMGPCIAMGAAAAHTLDLVGDGSVHNVDLDALKERLKDNLESKETSLSIVK